MSPAVVGDDVTAAHVLKAGFGPGSRNVPTSTPQHLAV